MMGYSFSQYVPVTLLPCKLVTINLLCIQTFIYCVLHHCLLYLNGFLYCEFQFSILECCMYVAMPCICNKAYYACKNVNCLGIPWRIPNVRFGIESIDINGNNVTLTLNWGEPFNNFDPIVNYTVSCSGDVTCLQILQLITIQEVILSLT